MAQEGKRSKRQAKSQRGKRESRIERPSESKELETGIARREQASPGSHE